MNLWLLRRLVYLQGPGREPSRGGGSVLPGPGRDDGDWSLQLALATGAFAVCFAIFGSVSAMMPILHAALDLSPVQVRMAVAVPVLLQEPGPYTPWDAVPTPGRAGRVPRGDGLFGRPGGADRVGDRVLAMVACGFLIGVALASFSVEVGS